MKKTIILVATFFVAVTIFAQAQSTQAVFRCFLQEGIGELYIEKEGVFEFQGSTVIFTGNLAKGPKTTTNDGATPWGRYTTGKTFIYKDGLPGAYVNYPNEQQVLMGYTGDNILIHGGRSSIGCISIIDTSFLENLITTIAFKSCVVEIFPSRMGVVRADLWRKVFPEHRSMIDTLQVLYSEFENKIHGTCDVCSDPVSVTVDFNWSSFSKKYDLARSENGLVVIDSLFGKIAPYIKAEKIVQPFEASDISTSSTRKPIEQGSCVSHAVLFDSIRIEKDNKLLIALDKIPNGYHVWINCGTVEGLAFKKQFTTLIGNELSDQIVLVYPDREEYLYSSSIEPSKRFEEGILLEGDYPQVIKLLSKNEERIFVRSAGEKGLFLPVRL